MCSILVSVVFLLYSDDLTDDVSTNIAIYADDTTLTQEHAGVSALW